MLNSLVFTLCIFGPPISVVLLVFYFLDRLDRMYRITTDGRLFRVYKRKWYPFGWKFISLHADLGEAIDIVHLEKEKNTASRPRYF